MLARFGGLGLGLAISKTFVERHGGRISATSDGLGHGAQFTIELPITTSPLFTQSGLTDAQTPPRGDSPSRILLIEDHADTLSTMTRLLTRRGHTVTAASTGAAARAEFGRATFDLIISDLGLPDCSGLELMAELRATHATLAIALSGFGMEADVLNSKSAGFDEHLTKPIDFELLLRTVNRLRAGE